MDETAQHLFLTVHRGLVLPAKESHRWKKGGDDDDMGNEIINYILLYGKMTDHQAKIQYLAPSRSFTSCKSQ